MLVGVSCVRGEIDMAEHVRCMMNERTCGYPPTILEKIVRPNFERMALEEAGVIYSPSSINGCHRRYSLQRDEPYYLDVEKAWPISRGVLMHDAMRMEPVPDGAIGVVRELRLAATVDTEYGPKDFSGQIDEILLKRVEDGVLHVQITDWKTKSDISHSMLEPEPMHVYQVNFYAWLVEHALVDYLLNWLEWQRAGIINESARFLLNSDDALGYEPFKTVAYDKPAVADTLEISYLAGNKVRTFTTDQFLYVRGKMKGATGTDGKWHRLVPEQYEELELAPLRRFDRSYAAGLIKKGIEEQVEAESQLAPPLTDERVEIMCPSCPVREQCYAMGLAQGYDMIEQRPYIKRLSIT